MNERREEEEKKIYFHCYRLRYIVNIAVLRSKHRQFLIHSLVSFRFFFLPWIIISIVLCVSDFNFSSVWYVSNVGALNYVTLLYSFQLRCLHRTDCVFFYYKYTNRWLHWVPYWFYFDTKKSISIHIQYQIVFYRFETKQNENEFSKDDDINSCQVFMTSSTSFEQI